MKKKLQHIRLLFMSLVAMTFFSCATHKEKLALEPVVKKAVVGFNSVYTDTIPLNDGTPETRVAVKMEFDEPSNLLTLSVHGIYATDTVKSGKDSLASPAVSANAQVRKVFVFKDDTRYNSVIRKRFLSRRRFAYSKLSYNVLVEPGTKIYLSKKVKRHFSRPKRNHVFANWLGEFSGDLTFLPPSQATNEAPEAVLISDSIVQRFKVDSTAVGCTIELRNFYTLTKLRRTKHDTYNIIHEQDAGTVYNIKLRRDACFGLEAELDSSAQNLYDITNAYHHLNHPTKSHTVQSLVARQIFYQHRQYLRQRYPRQTERSLCSAIQSNYDAYNKYVDSIDIARCAYVPPVDSIAVDKTMGPGTSALYLLDAAHNLDKAASRYVNSSDPAERHDMCCTGLDIMKGMNKTIKKQGVVNKEQRAALVAFRRAEAYFKEVIAGDVNQERYIRE